MSNIILPPEIQLEILEYLQRKNCKYCFKEIYKINDDFCNNKCFIKYNFLLQKELMYLHKGIGLLLCLWVPVMFCPYITIIQTLWIISLLNFVFLLFYIEIYFTKICTYKLYY